MKQSLKSASIILSLILMQYSPNSIAQTTNAQKLAPIIMLLLDGDNCLSIISTGDVIFDRLESTCLSERQAGGQFAAYYSFTHAGGPIHIDLISDFPNSYDPYLVLREGEGRDGVIVPNGEDDDGHDDNQGSRITNTNLASGSYTIEATAFNPGIAGAYNLSVYAGKVTAKETFKLNDTGVRLAGVSANTNSTSCNGIGNFANQDCALGRDANDNIAGGLIINDGDGVDGFSFLKVSSTGAPLPASATTWSCVKDNVTGFMWEVKTDNVIPDLQDKDHTFSWYNSNLLTNGGNAGIQNGGTCFAGVNCDTEGYAAAVNNTVLCGYSDWRVPTISELYSLINLATSFGLAPIDSHFFPNTPYQHYWSATPNSANSLDAWIIKDNGEISPGGGKGAPYRVRLIRFDSNLD